ncbi:helix-turn-helix domain-containing protein [Streptomyces sp. NPDC008121]|uniref:helix-turn-helix domain-containing protein n=1 Tax=Streptomyces sp. NPDC008121 TaxID=3364809 RepID=UPI0036F09FBD
MGVLMARRGKKRRLDLVAEYWRLLASGMGTVEACRQLGIGRKTGYRWREESGGVPPAHLPEALGPLSLAAGTQADRHTARTRPGRP